MYHLNGRMKNLNVGVVGHVDSGKTSLVGALSTVVSTAGLDKSPQSKARGITLDLGNRLPLKVAGEEEKQMAQITFVDCPGHASLLKTVLIGAQIIDAVLIVIDATKGIQAQTQECVAISEVITGSAILVFNKMDLLDSKHDPMEVEKQIRHGLHGSKFQKSPHVFVSAARSGNTTEYVGIDDLISTMMQTLVIPARRSISEPFLCAVDHCFSIKGQGTILTGTILKGKVAIGDIVQIHTNESELLNRAVKSIHSFRKAVDSAEQGDRVGVMVKNVKPSAVERTLISAPGEIKLFQSCIAVVRKLRQFNLPCKSRTKYHITIGHSTLLSTCTFFKRWISRDGRTEIEDGQSPDIKEVFQLEDELPVGYASYALVVFPHEVAFPPNLRMIGSRLDLMSSQSSDNNVLCRIAFEGSILTQTTDKEEPRFGKMKFRSGVVSKILDTRHLVVSDVLGKGSQTSKFQGMHVHTSSLLVGTIEDSFGTKGRFRVSFKEDHHCANGDPIFFNFIKIASSAGESEIIQCDECYILPKDYVKNIRSTPPENKNADKVENERKLGSLVVGPDHDERDAAIPSRKAGRVCAVKEGGIVIVEGLFSAEDNVEAYKDTLVSLEKKNLRGVILGPYGRRGKCKVRFEEFEGVIEDEIVYLN